MPDMEPRKQSAEEDYNATRVEQDDAYVNAETEQGDAATAKWAEDDYQLKQEIDREKSGAQIIAESNIEYQERLTDEEEKLWAFKHENSEAEHSASHRDSEREKQGEYRPDVLGISAEEFKKISDEFNSIEKVENVPWGNGGTMSI